MSGAENDPGPALLPCPFCGAGETVVHRNRGTWRGVRGYGEDVSVEVRHWCPPVEGQLTRGGITFVGRDLASAVAAWNRPRPVAPDAAPVPAAVALSGAVPVLRWEGPAGRTWDGYSGEECVAAMVEPCAGYGYRWYLRVDDRTKPFVESGMDADTARADVQAAFAAWCDRAGLVARSHHPRAAAGSGAVPRAGEAPDVRRAGAGDAPGGGAAAGQGGCVPGGRTGVQGPGIGGG